MWPGQKYRCVKRVCFGVALAAALLFLWLQPKVNTTPEPQGTASGYSSASANHRAANSANAGNARLGDRTRQTGEPTQSFEVARETVEGPASAVKTLTSVASTNDGKETDSAPLAVEPPEFEEVPTSWGVLDDGYDSYTLRSDRSLVWNGHASAVVRSSDAADSMKFGVLFQAASADSVKGNRVEVSAFLASENVLAFAALWFRADDERGTVVATAHSAPGAIRGTMPWTPQSIVLDVPLNAVIMFYGVTLSGPGALHVDDFRVVVVGTSVPTTNQGQSTSPGWSSTPPDLSQLAATPRNLDFEKTRVLETPE